MNDIYESFDEYNPNRKRKIFNVSDNMIADMLSKKNIQPTVTELFMRCRKRNISLTFITQFHFVVARNSRLNSSHYFIMQIPNKQEIQQTAINHSSDIDFKDFMNLYKKCSGNPYSFLKNDAALTSDNP